MPYLTQTDYEGSVRDQRLQQIIDEDLTILDNASDTAEAIVRDYLASRYDVEAIFALSGANRHAQVVRWCLMLALYIIYDRVEDDLVPERIIKNYDDTLQTLTMIADARMSANLPRIVDAESNPVTKFRWGSNPKRSH